MKVLHVYEYGLPYWRIEKSAITGLKYGYREFFAGMSSPEFTNNPKIFEKIYQLDWPWPEPNYPKKLYILYILLGKTSIWNAVKKQIKKILEEVRPDIVHAHNLTSAKLVSELDVPMIYNDHEYWSIYIKSIYESKMLNDNKKLSKKDFSKQKNY